MQVWGLGPNSLGQGWGVRVSGVSEEEGIEGRQVSNAESTANGSKQALFRWRHACCGQRAGVVSGSADLTRERGALSRGGPWAPQAPKKERKKESERVRE